MFLRPLNWAVKKFVVSKRKITKKKTTAIDLRYRIIWQIKDLKREAINLQKGFRGKIASLRHQYSTTIKAFFKTLSKIKITHPPYIFRWREDTARRPKPHHTPRFYKAISVLSLTIALIITLANSAYAFYYYILQDLPSPTKLTVEQVPQTTKIYDRNGILLYQIYGRQNRSWVALGSIPQTVVDATISMENKNFYQDPGFSVVGIARAALRQVQGQPLQGGSTITQQLVKNVFLTPKRTWTRKLKEFILALETERHYTKNEILEMYLNIVGYGGQAYGVEAAAEQYFGKPVGELTLAQAALLAGLTASPTTYSPYGAHPELAKQRQLEVLRRMFEDNKISYEQMQTAESEPLNYKPQGNSILAPHFVMWIRELLVGKYGEETVNSGGLSVTTSLDMNVQRMAEAEVNKQLATLQFENVTNGAAMVTHTTTGEVLAMVGSRNYWDTARDGNVNVCLALRQPGSSIKVVNYAVALEDGFRANTVIQDTAVSYPALGGPTYTPVNYDGRWHGPVTLRTALASSYNVPAVKVLAALGVPKMVAKGEALGINSWTTVDPGRFGLSLTLGGVEVRMTEMMEVYSTLGNMGQKVDLNPFLEVKDSGGRVLEALSSPSSSSPIVKPAVAYILSRILSDNGARSPAFGPSSVLNIPGYPSVAVKTGTTNNLRDNWTFGYTPKFTVGTWVGNNDNSPMSAVASGITGASPIWANIMKNLLTGSSDQPFSPPSDVVTVNICPQLGTKACGACPGYSEYFVAGTEPKATCSDEQIKKYWEEQQKKTEEAANKPVNQ